MGYAFALFLIGMNIVVATPTEAADKTAQQRQWTDEYQYGANPDAPKTGKPEEGGEFEIAPK